MLGWWGINEVVSGRWWDLGNKDARKKGSRKDTHPSISPNITATTTHRRRQHEPPHRGCYRRSTSTFPNPHLKHVSPIFIGPGYFRHGMSCHTPPLEDSQHHNLQPHRHICTSRQPPNSREPSYSRRGRSAARDVIVLRSLMNGENGWLAANEEKRG